MDGFNCIARKTLAIYFISLRWILLHSNKDRKFSVNDHIIIRGDMIPMIKFWRGYLGTDVIGEIRLLSCIDNVIDLMSKSTQTLMNCINSIIECEEPFAPKKQYQQQQGLILNMRELPEESISSQSSMANHDHDPVMLSIIDARNNPFNCGDLFLASNHRTVLLSILPYSIRKERDLILHILVRRIEKDAQKFVAEQIKKELSLKNNRINATPIISKKNKTKKNKSDNGTDSDGSFVSFEDQ